jgi:hypothetical protein
MLMDGMRARRLGLLIGFLLFLGACAHHSPDEADAGDDEVNAFPKSYKSDILAAMHVYLNDPTGIRDGAVTEPMLKPVSGVKHYVACLRFNGKKNGKEYAGPKEIAAVFIAGRFDHFVDASKAASELCAGAAYAPFPELSKLTR